MMQTERPLIIGTRGSALALYQAYLVRDTIISEFQLPVEIEIIETSGDKHLNISLQSNTLSKGLFTKEIEERLQDGSIDFAVHSLKDLPVCLEEGFLLGAVLDRVAVEDVLLSDKPITHLDECKGWKIGTSSPRRVAQLKANFPHLEWSFEPIRGNVQTRIDKMKSGQYDAIIMAKAGIARLGLQDYVVYTFPVHQLLPAPGQAALAIEIHESNDVARRVALMLNNIEDRLCTDTERALLQCLGGGCALPFGCYCELQDGEVKGQAFYAQGDLHSGCSFTLPTNYSSGELKSLANHLKETLHP